MSLRRSTTELTAAPSGGSERLQAVLRAGAAAVPKAPAAVAGAASVPAPTPTAVWARDGMQEKLYEWFRKDREDSITPPGAQDETWPMKVAGKWTMAYKKELRDEMPFAGWKGWDVDGDGDGVPWQYRMNYPTVKKSKKSKRETSMFDPNKSVHAVRLNIDDTLAQDWRVAVFMDLESPEVTVQLEFSMGLLGWKKWSHRYEGSERVERYAARDGYEGMNEFLQAVQKAMTELVKHNWQYLDEREDAPWNKEKKQ